LVSASIVVAGAAVEVEQLWHDRFRWASWIDGFGHLGKLEGEWPLEGARRLWDSPPGGRGRVMETVTAYEAGRGQTLRVEDARVAGVQRVAFVSDGERTQITLELEVEPKAPLKPARRWWLRRTFGQSLRRTLQRFAYELAAER
jgi:hypothetical protein